jgi:hypothetical protein
MESPNERGDIDPIIDKIRSGEISVIEAVAEELPDVFRTHVVPKLCLKDTLNLARVNKSFYEAVWSAEGFGSIQKKCPIWCLLQTNNTRGLRAYIRAGVDLEQRYTPISEDTRPLHFAIICKHSECAVLLIEAGCDVNVCCRHEGGHPLCMALLLSTFIDVTAIVSALLEAGADVNARYTAFDPSMSYLAGYTALGLAVSGFHEDHIDDIYEIPKILLDAGADPNATFNRGNTALHLIVHLVEGAADEKMEKMARLLLDAGADTRRRNDEGRTPLEYAIAFEHAGMIALLAIASS